MIKDVLNSISSSAGAAKTSSSVSGETKSTEGNEGGFFGKMLMALQSDVHQQPQKEGEASAKKESSEENKLLNTNTEMTVDGEAEADPLKVASEGSEEDGSTVITPENLSNAESDSLQKPLTTKAEKMGETEGEKVTGSDQALVDNTIANESPADTQGNALSGLNGSENGEAPVEKGFRPARAEANISNAKPEGEAEQQPGLATLKDGITEIQEEGSQKPILTDSAKGTSHVAEGSEKMNVSSDPRQVVSEAPVSSGKAEGVIAKNQSDQIAEAVAAKGNRMVSESPQATEFEKTDTLKKQVPESQPKVHQRFMHLNRTGVEAAVPGLSSTAEKAEVTQTQNTANSQKITHEAPSKVELKGQPMLQTEMNNARSINEERAKRYDLINQNSDGRMQGEERIAPVTSRGGSGSGYQGMNFSSQPGWMKFQANNEQSLGLTAEQQAFFNDQVINATELSENGTVEQDKMSTARLSELPINNVMLKRSVLPGLSNVLQKATASGKEMPQSWQKHSFDLDDGNKIELTTRNVDGIIQVKIASTSIELSKLMQQYGEEIKDHLQNECELTIDLQFEDQQGEASTDLFGDSSPGQKGRQGFPMGQGSNRNLNKQSEEHLQQTVRKFGYNQMEWTI